MKILNTALQTALSSEVQTLARFWLITRQDGVKLGFTNYSQDLTIDNVTYKASIGFTPTAIEMTLGSDPVNMELSSILNSNGINAKDLKRGVYNYARVTVFLANYLDLPANLLLNPPKHLSLLTGVIGKVTYSEDTFSAEVLSLATFLGVSINNSISKTCRYQFGDSRCKVDLSNWEYSATVTAVGATNKDFTFNFSSEEDWFTGGKVTWNTGNNAGLEIAIIKSINNQIYLQTSPAEPIQIGDTCTLQANCQKSEADCVNKNNRENFGGEPDLPGLDFYYSGENN